MTLKEALTELKAGKIVTRTAWVGAGELKYLIPHGNYTKNVGDLYSGKLKEILEANKATTLEFMFHVDKLITAADNSARLIVGYQPSHVDEWANDYITVALAEASTISDEPLTEEQIAELKPEDVIELTGEETLTELAQRGDVEIVITKAETDAKGESV